MTTEEYIDGMRAQGIDRGILEHGVPPEELKTIGGIEERRNGYRLVRNKTERGKDRFRPPLEDLSALNPEGWRLRQTYRKRSDGRQRRWANAEPRKPATASEGSSAGKAALR